MIRYSIFIVDDEKDLAEAVALCLAPHYDVRVFGKARDALEAMKGDPPDLVLLDIRMPVMDGIEALERIRHQSPGVLVIMVTAFEETRTVVKAMRLGAHDYVVKPIQMDLLDLVVKKALESIRLRKEVRALQERMLLESFPWFVGRSRAIQGVMQFVDAVARSQDTPVLILGESGTGKELVASAIHFRSPNYQGPMISVNCAAIPANLVESELFGYARGAFSGAAAPGKKGFIEEAEGGTLFLDEIGDLSLDAQAKLLRFLDSGDFFRVGSTRRVSVKTRIISATNKDLDRMVREGRFREDFLFRIGVLKVEVPSLKDRPEDIMPIAQHFLVEFSEKFKKPFEAISTEAEQALKSYPWKGNIRELRNVIERAVLIEEGPVPWLRDLASARDHPHAADGPASGLGGAWSIPEEGVNLSFILDGVERKYLEKALERSGGNETEAARLLGMKYSTLRYRKKKLLGD